MDYIGCIKKSIVYGNISGLYRLHKKNRLYMENINGLYRLHKKNRLYMDKLDA